MSFFSNSSSLALGQLWRLGRHYLWIGDATRFQDAANQLQAYCSWSCDLVFSDLPFGLSAQIVRDVIMQFSDNLLITGSSLEYHRLCSLPEFRYCFEIVSQRNQASFQPRLDEPYCLHWNNAARQASGPHCFDRSLLADEYAASIQPLYRFELNQGFVQPSGWALNLLSACRAETVCDPFVGTGTVLLACEQLNKSARTIDIDLNQCRLTLNRWTALTGQTPGRLL